MLRTFSPRRLGRFVLQTELASGGMATVHLGRLIAEGGFSRFVAIKLLDAKLARDPQFRSMFLDEARIVAHIRHANVVSTLDIVESEGELFLVMDYVHGPALSSVIKRERAHGTSIPLPIASAIAVGMLEGLHAAHEARNELGQPLSVVHRDVSPQNILIGSDGVARVLDFGIAHAADRLQRTTPGQIKGKAAYMAPEQARGDAVDRRADVYAAAIVLWETTTGKRLFQGENFSAVLLKQLFDAPAPPSAQRADVPSALDAIVLRGLSKDPSARFQTAHEMAEALAACVPPATHAEVGSWLALQQGEFFAARHALLESAERIGIGPSEAGPTSETLPIRPATDTTLDALAASSRRLEVRVPILVASSLIAFAVASIAALGVTTWVRSSPPPPHPNAQALPTAVAAAASTSALPPPPLDSAVGEILGAPPTSASIFRAPSPSPPRRQPVAQPRASGSGDPGPLPPCCVNALQIRYHDCVDNCPQ